MRHVIRLVLLSPLILLGANWDCSTKLSLECVDASWGLYGEISTPTGVLHAWSGPCSELTAQNDYSVEHAVDEGADTIRAMLLLSGVGQTASATAQARFQTTLGERYRLRAESYRVTGSVADHEQGVFVRVRCPSRDASEDLSWWFDENGWLAGDPAFAATATETCQVEMRELCFHAGGQGASGVCGAEMSVRWIPVLESPEVE